MAQDSSRENWNSESPARSEYVNASRDSAPGLGPAATKSKTPMLTGAIAALAAGIALVFGAVFYGMNATSVDPNTAPVATTVPDTPLSPAAQEAQNQQSSPAADRRIAPSNAQPGATTGAAPSQAK